ncbi:MAG: hypothetical protein IJ147_11480 [Lachnospiraceae bacterium]|nr:hypothetical protein [Lachnospiraceae bacterium]
MKLFITEQGDACIELENELTDVLTKFNSAFSESDKIAVPATSIPMMLYAGYVVIKRKKSFSKLIESVNAFISGYDQNDAYKAYLQKGTASAENVRGRFDYWKEMIKGI